MSRPLRVKQDPYVVVRARLRRSTLERVYAAAKEREVKPATLIRMLLDRATRAG